MEFYTYTNINCWCFILVCQSCGWRQTCIDLASLWAVVQNLASRATAQSFPVVVLSSFFPPVDVAVCTRSHSVLKCSGGDILWEGAKLKPRKSTTFIWLECSWCVWFGKVCLTSTTQLQAAHTKFQVFLLDVVYLLIGNNWSLRKQLGAQSLRTDQWANADGNDCDACILYMPCMPQMHPK